MIDENVEQALAALKAEYPMLDGLALLILYGLRGGLSGNSRRIAKELGVEHALIIRAAQELAEAGCAVVETTDSRSGRIAISLAPDQPSSPL
ncbi:hypothetical protein E1162_15365 [Rhodobacteraceae bacterium RKSG542]|uniref:hypothetical protein n=1 Tax=Pseudovibrio flavus TaxID=2529854 RepID=UPI0012BC70E7|nr:hypothetical protein [Pseudovibrio flavus]MTI18622.1 hypothetical protein [Pseudovibrio flavus]